MAEKMTSSIALANSLDIPLLQASCKLPVRHLHRPLNAVLVFRGTRSLLLDRLLFSTFGRHWHEADISASIRLTTALRDGQSH